MVGIAVADEDPASEARQRSVARAFTNHESALIEGGEHVDLVSRIEPRIEELVAFMHSDLWVGGAVDEPSCVQSVAVKEREPRREAMLQSCVFVCVAYFVDWEVDVETRPGGEHALRLHVITRGRGHELHTRHQLAELLGCDPVGLGFCMVVVDIHHHAVRGYEGCG